MRRLLWTIFAAASLFAGCREDSPPITNAEPPPDAGCVPVQVSQRYQVYFVIDVSGSMGPFLSDLADSLTAFAESFPERDDQDQRVLVEYYVVGFVNDVKWFPEATPRMTSVIAVQAAIQEAITAGSNGQNLQQRSANAEVDENLLDALAAVIASNPDPDATKMILLATDANFREAPDTFSLNIPVQSTFGTILSDLTELGAQIHSFTPGGLDGLTRTYRDQPALTTLPGSSVNDLNELGEAQAALSERLVVIAQGATCQ